MRRYSCLGALPIADGPFSLETVQDEHLELIRQWRNAQREVLRQREPNAPRPFKAWGYPIAPAIFCAACFIILANALYTDLVKTTMNGQPVGPSAWGLLVIGLGLPIYYFFARRR